MANTFVLSFFPVLMVIAGIGDFFTLRIPNWLNALIAATMVPMAVALGMPLDIMGLHVAAGFIMLFAGMSLFFAGQIGGGDQAIFDGGHAGLVLEEMNNPAHAKLLHWLSGLGV